MMPKQGCLSKFLLGDITMKYCQVCKQEYVAGKKVCQCADETAAASRAEDDGYTGRTIDSRYQVLNRLAAGSMGSVYLAQVDTGKQIAIKILKSQFALNPSYVKLFCRTASLAANLKHTRIDTVLDFDQTAEGCLFVAMDYVDGESLRNVLGRVGCLDIGEALRYGEQIAEGLAAAHRRGVIHRDLRPENIMVLRDGGTVKIMDFAIPRVEDIGTSGGLAEAELVFGKPEYRAPERVQGGEPTEQSDIYALGIVLYEMLTGRVPFKGPSHLATLLGQVNQMPQRLRLLRPEIPAPLETLVLRALEKKPEKRQKSMVQLAGELAFCAKLPAAPGQALLPVAVPSAATAILPRDRLQWKVAGGLAAGVLAIAGYLVFMR
jgi:serine/threonine-protein kinase